MKCLMLAVAIFANGFDYCGATPPDRIYVIKEIAELVELNVEGY